MPYAFTFWWSVPPRWIWLAYALSMTVLFWFTIGLWTRVSSILSVVVVISFANRVPEALFGLDKIIIMLTLYLAIGPSGKALSVDSWLAPPRSNSLHPSPLHRRQFRATAYPDSYVHRVFLRRSFEAAGTVWWNGQAMWMTFANLEYQSIDMTWTAWHPWAVELLSHFTLFWELSFCVLIWVPALRPLVLSAALVLHLGIGATMGLWTFSLVMLIGCASFLPPEARAKLANALARARRGRETSGVLPSSG